MEFTPENKAKFDELLTRYPVKRSALLPALAPRPGAGRAGSAARPSSTWPRCSTSRRPRSTTPPASTRCSGSSPRGRRYIEFCTTLSCALGGAEELIASHLQEARHRAGRDHGRRQVHGEAASSAWPPAAGAPAVQVNGEWLEHATRGRHRPGPRRARPVRRTFDWPKSPGEHDPLPERLEGELGRPSRPTRRAAATRTSRSTCRMTPDEIIDDGQEVGPARPRRRGLPDRPEVELPAQGQPEAALPLRERRRERAGHLQGPRAHRERPAPAHRGAASSRCHAIRLARPAYIYIRGEFHEGFRTLEKALARGLRRRATSARTSSAPGVDVDIYVHRGAGSYECGEETALIESLEGKRGQPRLKPPFPAVVGPLRLPDDRQQRRDARATCP